jgi:hypothetical protein
VDALYIHTDTCTHALQIKGCERQKKRKREKLNIKNKLLKKTEG